LFKDEGISGAKVDEEALEVDRMGFQEMLEFLSHQNVDYVVTLNTSRLWRSDIVKVLVQQELKKYGVDIRSIEQPQYSIHKKDSSDFLINGHQAGLQSRLRRFLCRKPISRAPFWSHRRPPRADYPLEYLKQHEWRRTDNNQSV